MKFGVHLSLTGFLQKTIYANITFSPRVGEGEGYFRGQLGNFGQVIFTQGFDPQFCRFSNSARKSPLLMLFATSWSPYLFVHGQNWPVSQGQENLFNHSSHIHWTMVI